MISLEAPGRFDSRCLRNRVFAVFAVFALVSIAAMGGFGCSSSLLPVSLLAYSYCKKKGLVAFMWKQVAALIGVLLPAYIASPK